MREALRTLKVMNIINIKQGKGAFVSSVDISLLIDHMDFVSLLEKTTVLNLFEARRILEPEIAALAAQRITEQEIEDLRALLTQDNFDVILHQKIAECTKNPVLIRFVASIWTLSDMSRRRTSKIPGVKQKTYKMQRTANRSPCKPRCSTGKKAYVRASGVYRGVLSDPRGYNGFIAFVYRLIS